MPNYTGPVTVAPKRSIGGLTADVTVEEEHDDRLTVTEHPVEQGAAISDHAFKNPARLVIRVGYSNSSPQAGGNSAYVNEQYDKFLAFQVARDLLTVYTARRTYKNMLITGLGLTTDVNTENSLLLTVSLQEIILATTQTVQVPSNDVQTMPQKTATPVKTGTKQAAPVVNPPVAATTPGAATGIPQSQFLTPVT